jgi:hypothetical protein
MDQRTSRTDESNTGRYALMKFVSEQTISDNFIPILYQHHFLLIVCSNK